MIRVITQFEYFRSRVKKMKGSPNNPDFVASLMAEAYYQGRADALADLVRSGDGGGSLKLPLGSPRKEEGDVTITDGSGLDLGQCQHPKIQLDAELNFRGGSHGDA